MLTVFAPWENRLDPSAVDVRGSWEAAQAGEDFLHNLLLVNLIGHEAGQLPSLSQAVHGRRLGRLGCRHGQTG